MQLFILIACDRLEEDQEKKLKNNLAKIRAAIQGYGEQYELAQIIDDCDNEFCDLWQIGIEQPIKKAKQLVNPINFFNDLCKQFQLDAEVGMVENDEREAVSYFGTVEGHGDPFMIAQYLDL